MKRLQGSSYGPLIEEVTKLLCEKDSLQSKIFQKSNLRYHVYDPKEDQSRLERIIGTIKEIARRHAELVRLVMRKLTLQKEADRTPSGNAGYRKQVECLNELRAVEDKLDKLVAA